MKGLIIDTSTSVELVIAWNGEGIADATGTDYTSHATTLFSRIEKALRHAGTSIEELDILITGTGPGSFTGIRIAVTTARMLSQVSGVPLLGMPSPEIYHHAILPKDSLALVAFDAKKGKVFGALYTTEDANTRALLEPGDYSMEDILRFIPEGSKVHAYGDGIDVYSDVIRKKTDPVIHDIEERNPQALISKVTQRLSGTGLDDHNYQKIIPYYSRKSDAEIMKEKRKSDSGLLR